jgi:hypothetical protein
LVEKQGYEYRNQNHPEYGQEVWDSNDPGGHSRFGRKKAQKAQMMVIWDAKSS